MSLRDEDLLLNNTARSELKLGHARVWSTKVDGARVAACRDCLLQKLMAHSFCTDYIEAIACYSS